MKGFYDKDKMIQNNLLLTVRSLREYGNIFPISIPALSTGSLGGGYLIY